MLDLHYGPMPQFLVLDLILIPQTFTKINPNDTYLPPKVVSFDMESLYILRKLVLNSSIQITHPTALTLVTGSTDISYHIRAEIYGLFCGSCFNTYYGPEEIAN